MAQGLAQLAASSEEKLGDGIPEPLQDGDVLAGAYGEAFPQSAWLSSVFHFQER